MKTHHAVAASLMAMTVGSSAAWAGAFAIREQSTVAQGQSFAGAASGSGGVSSMFWNPATITMSPGWVSEYNVTAIIPSATVTPIAPTPTLAFGGSGELSQSAAVPASYTSYQFNENIWFGLATTAPFGLSTKPNVAWSGQVYARSSRVYSLNVNPIIGIKLTDWLSIGAGPTIQYFQVRLRSAAGAAPAAGSVLLEGDDIGFGFTAGATITPMKGTVIGIGYRSSIQQEVEGSLRTPAAYIPVRTSVNLPEVVTIGLTQAITEQFKLNLGFEFTNWSRVNTPAIIATTSGTPVSSLALSYKDGYLYSLGGEYQYNTQWAFRAGVAYEQSPISLRNRTPRLPDTDRIWGSIGASYKYNEKLTFDLAYSHLFQVGSNNGISILPGSPSYAGLPFVATTDGSADIVSLAVKYRWDDVAAAIPAPIIRKY